MELQDEKGNVICQLCGKVFKVITAMHLNKEHQIDMKQYRNDFPNAILIGTAARARLKYNKKTIFKEDKIYDAPKPIKQEIEIEEFQIDKIPVLKEKTKRVSDFIEEVKTFAEETSLEYPNDGGFIHRDKHKILSYLLSIYPDLQNSYFIEKYTIGKTLEYKLVTDICSPLSRIDFEFPDTFWHNLDIPKSSRDEKLKKDGWKIVNVKGVKPSIEELKKILKQI